MRFSIATIAIYAALVLGQSSENAINIPAGQQTLDITAGEPTTITWQNPSSGTVTIRLQYAGTDQLASSGIVLASDVPASAGGASFVIPASAVTADGSYTIRITDDTNPSNVNFAPAFTVSGATGTASLPAGGSATATDSSGTRTGTSSDSSSTDSSSATTTASDSTSTTESESSTASSTSSRSSRTSSSATASETTSAPSAAAAAFLKVEGGALAVLAAAAAFL